MADEEIKDLKLQLASYQPEEQKNNVLESSVVITEEESKNEDTSNLPDLLNTAADNSPSNPDSPVASILDTTPQENTVVNITEHDAPEVKDAPEVVNDASEINDTPEAHEATAAATNAESTASNQQKEKESHVKNMVSLFTAKIDAITIDVVNTQHRPKP